MYNGIKKIASKQNIKKGIIGFLTINTATYLMCNFSQSPCFSWFFTAFPLLNSEEVQIEIALNKLNQKDKTGTSLFERIDGTMIEYSKEDVTHENNSDFKYACFHLPAELSHNIFRENNIVREVHFRKNLPEIFQQHRNEISQNTSSYYHTPSYSSIKNYFDLKIESNNQMKNAPSVFTIDSLPHVTNDDYFFIKAIKYYETKISTGEEQHYIATILNFVNRFTLFRLHNQLLRQDGKYHYSGYWTTYAKAPGWKIKLATMFRWSYDVVMHTKGILEALLKGSSDLFAYSYSLGSTVIRTCSDDVIPSNEARLWELFVSKTKE